MRTGWETKRLGDFAAAVSTGPFGSILHKSDYVDDGVPLVNPTNIVGESIVPDPSKLISTATKKRLSSYVLEEGDVVVARRGEIGRCAVISPGENGWVCGTGSFFIRPLPTLDSQFLAHLIRSDRYREKLEKLSTGTTMLNLSNTALGSLDISVPPLPEQQRIVGLLDEAFERIATAKAHAEKNLQNARALFESHLQSVFTQRGPGWMEATLESSCEQIFAGGDVPKDRLSQERTLKFSVPIYSNGEKDGGLYGFTDVARVTKPSITVSARGTLGFTAIRTEPFLPVVRLIVLVPDYKQIMLSFLYYAVVGMDFGNTGTSIPQLTVPNFKESKLHIPSLSEQKLIVEKLDALSKETQHLARLYERKLAALEALKKSLLHKAFSGNL